VDSGLILVFIDGQPAFNSGTFTGPIGQPNQNLLLGRFEGQNSNCWTGLLDEVRLSRIARTECWLTTSFRNQSDPENFYTLGEEQAY
jgi:hypothetical protein